MIILQAGISVSIVTYNTWPRTLENVESLLESLRDHEFEILIFDNGERPVSLPYLPENVTIHRGEENIGFGAGNNKNLEIAKFNRFFILNPDITSNRESVNQVVDALDGAGAVGVSPLLIGEDGEIQHSFRKFPSLKTELARIAGLDRRVGTRNSTVMVLEQGTGTFVVEQPAGAALLVRTDVMKTIGGFDERFPMYFEDVDLCQRLIEMGEIRVVTDATFIHDGEGTAKSYRKATTFWIENSRKRYFLAHKRGIARALHWTVGIVSCVTHAAGAALSAVKTQSPEKKAELQAKASGYRLAVLSYFYGSDTYWKQRMMGQA